MLVRKYIGIPESTLVIAVVFFCLFFGVFLIYSLSVLLRDTHIWLIGTIICMILIFLGGVYVLDAEVGLPDMGVYVYHYQNSSKPVTSMFCVYQKQTEVEPAGYICTLDQIEASNATILLYSSNNITYNIISPTGIRFPYEDNVTSIKFDIQGIDYNNQSIHYEATRQIHLFNEDFYNAKREQFLAWLAALIGIIIITIPTAALNLKKIAEKTSDNTPPENNNNQSYR